MCKLCCKLTVDEEKLNEIHGELDCDLIDVSYYCEMEDQTASALDDIEDQLMEKGIIPQGQKLFFPND